MNIATTERTLTAQTLGSKSLAKLYSQALHGCKLQRYRVVFKGLNVIVNARGSYEARVFARVKFLAMYTDSTPDEGLADIDTFSELAKAAAMGNR